MKYDTFVSLTAAIADEYYRQSHGSPPSALWLMQDRSVVALCPSWPLPDDALVQILAADPLEMSGEPFTRNSAALSAIDWMEAYGGLAIYDAENMVNIMAEQERICAEQEAAWTLYEKGETCQS